MKNGFTLTELLIVSTIIGILLTIGLAGYNNFNRKTMVREAALALLNNLRYAQEKALSGEKPRSGCDVLNGWKLEFTSNDEYEIQAICGGVETGDAKVFSLPSEVSKEPGTGLFLFKALGQGVDFSDPGEIVLSGFGKWRYQIKVTHSGEISDEGFL